MSAGDVAADIVPQRMIRTALDSQPTANGTTLWSSSGRPICLFSAQESRASGCQRDPIREAECQPCTSAATVKWRSSDLGTL